MAFFLFWSLHSRYPFFNTISQHITDIYPPPPHSNSSSSTSIITPPPPRLYHPTPPVFLALRTEPNQNVLFCCLGGGSVWYAAHGVFRTTSSSVHFPRCGLVHFFSAFLLGVWCGIAFLHGWMDGRWGGWRDGWGSIGDILHGIGKGVCIPFYGWMGAGPGVGCFLVGR